MKNQTNFNSIRVILDTISSDQFANIFLEKRPFLDVRAEVEFNKGAFPNSKNLPILNNSERGKVGHCYKHKGADAAVVLGHQLVSGNLKHQRLCSWKSFIEKNPDAVLYCFRGGMRSKLAQQWLDESGCKIPRIEGGYKALRNFLLNEIELWSDPNKLLIVGGRTGTGKTRVIHAVNSTLDLEGLANHRGSAFGKMPQPQPQQINFENSIAIEFLKHSRSHLKQIILEDESKLIGRNVLPINLKFAMEKARLVVVNESLASRIQIVIEEYVTDLHHQFALFNPTKSSEEIWKLYTDAMYLSLFNIQKKIGAIRYKNLLSAMQSAMQDQLINQSKALHAAWIEPLLTEYYDKMYDYQLAKKQQRIIFQGSREEVISYLS